MKKFSLLAIGITSAIFSFAQNPGRFGIKAGLNVANLKVENFDNTDSRLGFHAGLLAHLHLARQWALQPEVVYSAEGATFDFGGGE